MHFEIREVDPLCFDVVAVGDDGRELHVRNFFSSPMSTPSMAEQSAHLRASAQEFADDLMSMIQSRPTP